MGGIADSTWQELHVAIVNGKPVMWRADRLNDLACSGKPTPNETVGGPLDVDPAERVQDAIERVHQVHADLEPGEEAVAGRRILRSVETGTGQVVAKPGLVTLESRRDPRAPLDVDRQALTGVAWCCRHHLVASASLHPILLRMAFSRRATTSTEEGRRSGDFSRHSITKRSRSGWSGTSTSSDGRLGVAFPI